LFYSHPVVFTQFVLTLKVLPLVVTALRTLRRARYWDGYIALVCKYIPRQYTHL